MKAKLKVMLTLIADDADRSRDGVAGVGSDFLSFCGSFLFLLDLIAGAASCEPDFERSEMWLWRRQYSVAIDVYRHSHCWLRNDQRVSHSMCLKYSPFHSRCI